MTFYYPIREPVHPRYEQTRTSGAPQVYQNSTNSLRPGKCGCACLVCHDKLVSIRRCSKIHYIRFCSNNHLIGPLAINHGVITNTSIADPYPKRAWQHWHALRTQTHVRLRISVHPTMESGDAICSSCDITVFHPGGTRCCRKAFKVSLAESSIALRPVLVGWIERCCCSGAILTLTSTFTAHTH